MRKWMRERLQRRKKNTDKNTDKEKQPAPPPLQPAYFEAGADPESPEPGSSDHSPVAVEYQPAQVQAEAGNDRDDEDRGSAGNTVPQAEPVANGENAEAKGNAQRGRGRRRRGGRGRGGRGREQAVAQAFAPKSSAPAAAEGEEPSADGAIEPTPQVPQVPAAPSRTPKGLVVLAIGLPGSGKSTWFKRHNIVPLSSDMMRSLLFDDVREQRFQDLVFSNLRSMLKARLIAKRPTNYVDATNLTPQERQHWIKLAKDYGYEVHALFFDVPLEVCLERHNRRDRIVPEDIMRRMAGKLKPPAFPEGFAKITVVRVKKKEDAEEPASPEE